MGMGLGSRGGGHRGWPCQRRGGGVRGCWLEGSLAGAPGRVFSGFCLGFLGRFRGHQGYCAEKFREDTRREGMLELNPGRKSSSAKGTKDTPRRCRDARMILFRFWNDTAGSFSRYQEKGLGGKEGRILLGECFINKTPPIDIMEAKGPENGAGFLGRGRHLPLPCLSREDVYYSEGGRGVLRAKK